MDMFKRLGKLVVSWYQSKVVIRLHLLVTFGCVKLKLFLYCVLKMSGKTLHVDILFNFSNKKGEIATQICKQICEVYGDEVIGKSTVRKWFVNFKSCQLPP